MRVLQIGTGVALEGDHAVEVEDVVVLALGREVGVLDGRASDLLGELVLVISVEIGATLIEDDVGALDRLVDQ